MVDCEVPIAALLPAYLGKGGLPISDNQAGSGAVPGLPSSSARRMAVTGRHKPYCNLLAKVVCRASCRAMLVRAKRRAFSTVVRLRARATLRATLFQTRRKLVGVLT